jgi:hypothetical protein
VSFGENIIGKGQVQLFLLADASLGKRSYATEVMPGVLYGITNTLSLFCNAPIAPRNKDHNHHSAGFEDAFMQFEYAFYNKSTYDTASQATVVANVSFPTGSSSKDPPTGYGTYAYFLGATFNLTNVYWFVFTSAGTTLTASRHKAGYKYLYELGVGRFIANHKGWLFAWMIEFDGLYSEKSRPQAKDHTTPAGHIIYITPSLWASSNRWIVQFGVSYPAQLKQSGPRQYVMFDFNLGITL